MLIHRLIEFIPIYSVFIHRRSEFIYRFSMFKHRWTVGSSALNFIFSMLSKAMLWRKFVWYYLLWDELAPLHYGVNNKQLLHGTVVENPTFVVPRKWAVEVGELTVVQVIEFVAVQLSTYLAEHSFIKWKTQ